MQVRRISGQEHFEANLISAIAFHERIEDMEKAREKALACKDEDWGAFSEDGKLMARIINNHFISHFDGNLIKNGGIGAVSTLPEYRVSGAIRAIFQELLPQVYKDGEIISTLYPFNHEFYGKVGYETISWQNDYEFEPEILQKYRFDGDAILWRSGDPVSEYTDLYNRFASGYNLTVQRTDESMLKSHIEGDCYKDRKFCYLLKKDGKAVAYLIFQDIKEDPQAILSVQDLAWEGREGFLAIFGFLARFSADYGKIRIFMPSNIDLISLIRSKKLYNMKKTGCMAYMARVINVQKLLSYMYKPDDAPFVIKVTDEIIPENDHAFKVAGESVEITDEQPDLCVSVRALAQLAIGSVSLSEAMYREDVSIHGNEDVLKRIFVRKPLLIEEHF
ncbi:MAG: GNAT family N-acetyltransferase [Lachnospiraceae bacterium]|nr:GNAT family N-acetyltransferase [Lachnospiraceae bacterium]